MCRCNVEPTSSFDIEVLRSLDRSRKVLRPFCSRYEETFSTISPKCSLMMRLASVVLIRDIFYLLLISCIFYICIFSKKINKNAEINLKMINDLVDWPKFFKRILDNISTYMNVYNYMYVGIIRYFIQFQVSRFYPTDTRR